MQVKFAYVNVKLEHKTTSKTTTNVQISLNFEESKGTQKLMCIFRHVLALHIRLVFSTQLYNTREHLCFTCLIDFSRDHSSIKLIIFLDSKLERLNSRVAKLNSRLDSRNFRGSRIESRVEFRNSRVTVNLPLSGTVYTVCLTSRFQ